MNLRRLIKLGHEIGSAGFAGALVAQIVLLSLTPAPTELQAYATLRGAIAAVGTWVLFPSLFLVIFSGVLAIMVNRAFHNAGWAWLKFATGISVFEGTLVAIHGPARRAAEEATLALAGEIEVAELSASAGEGAALWVVLAIALINFWLGVWRPRFSRRVTELDADESSSAGDDSASAPSVEAR